MTREEAIKFGKRVLFLSLFDEMHEFCEIAVKALEQEPCEDAINRQAVMDCFKKWQPYMATRLWDFEQELSALPSVKPQESNTDVLDKIKAEIEEYKSRQLTLTIGVEDLEKGKQTALEYVLAILDKYKAESEDEE